MFDDSHFYATVINEMELLDQKNLEIYEYGKNIVGGSGHPVLEKWVYPWNVPIIK